MQLEKLFTMQLALDQHIEKNMGYRKKIYLIVRCLHC